MEYKKIKMAVEDGIAFIKLNSPESYNALTLEMSSDLLHALEACNVDPKIRVVVLSGEGKAFCAGGDLKAFNSFFASDDKPDTTIEFGSVIRSIGNLTRLIRRLRMPVICAIHGSAAGAGANLALVCDFKIASEEVSFIEAFVNVGVVPDMGGTYVLSKHVGVAKLTEAVMLGEPISARDALALGMINQVVPRDQLENAAIALAGKLISKPALSLAKMKRLINQAAFGGLDTALEMEEEYQVLCAGSGNFKEGIAAFVEKRKPGFKA
jgi:enoyl-CoA hydratase/carnithine racemase